MTQLRLTICRTLQNSYRHLRAAADPAFTVTGSAVKFGPNAKHMRVLDVRTNLKLMDVNYDDYVQMGRHPGTQNFATWARNAFLSHLRERC